LASGGGCRRKKIDVQVERLASLCSEPRQELLPCARVNSPTCIAAGRIG